MLSVTYVSSATRLLGEPELIDLLTSVRPKNDRLGLTGMLLYRDGNIIQTLEGPDDAVESTYATIAADSRHKGILMLINEQMSERRFPDWSMSFHQVSGPELEKLEGFSAFLKSSGDQFGSSTEPVYRMLELFRDNMR